MAADIIFGGIGDDVVRAFATDAEAATAADLLFGGLGNDTVQGGAANDTIEGGEGDDVLTGNGGADRFVFRAAQATGDDEIQEFGRTTGDVAELAGFDPGFDPLANLTAATGGAVLDLGDGDSFFFAGRRPEELAADDIAII